MEQLKHECGVAMIRLLKPLEYYVKSVFAKTLVLLFKSCSSSKNVISFVIFLSWLVKTRLLILSIILGADKAAIAPTMPRAKSNSIKVKAIFFFIVLILS